jgi:hypothetical protein
MSASQKLHCSFVINDERPVCADVRHRGDHCLQVCAARFSCPTPAGQRCHFERPLLRIPVGALLQQRLMSPDPPRMSNL